MKKDIAKLKQSHLVFSCGTELGFATYAIGHAEERWNWWKWVSETTRRGYNREFLRTHLPHVVDGEDRVQELPLLPVVITWVFSASRQL